MKIYTKGGDKGSTALFGGRRVSKADVRIEAYGTVDELNSFLGLLGDHLKSPEMIEEIHRLQNNLFTIGSILASDPDAKNLKRPELSEDEVTHLENRIDAMDVELKPLKNFILPGGNKANSLAHVCRCICRRAERQTVGLMEEHEEIKGVIVYLNRLSDYFFTLARWISNSEKSPEIAWKPRAN